MSEQLAAIDLGSNSFHLVIARRRGKELRMLDRVREPVQLARGLTKRGTLSKGARVRALDALERLGQRVRHVGVDRVRAVGTNTLRLATNAPAFLAEAEEALGVPVEVISGHEEARLIYLGVAHSLPDDPGPRLVVDIGGGSTECILGEGFEAREVHSLDIGCVSYSQAFFPDGVLTSAAFDKATLKAENEVRTIERAFRNTAWSRAVGASGTIRAAETVVRAAGWGPDGITATGLKRLRRAMVTTGHIDKLDLKGLRPDRARVFPGGLAILQALFARLGIERMEGTSGALREGVLYDLLGRIRHEDVRERTINGTQERHRVDVAQARRVERTALALLSHAPRVWGLDLARDGRMLSWAARLHEIGLSVAWSKHHEHGGYLIEHADMPGFGRDDQHLLATLVANHRRKLDVQALNKLSDERYEYVTSLIVILRIAVLLHRARSPARLPVMRLVGDSLQVRLRCPKRWLAGEPLTRMDLEDESQHLASIGIDFDVER